MDIVIDGFATGAGPAIRGMVEALGGGLGPLTVTR
jgi:hypothetical protein